MTLHDTPTVPVLASDDEVLTTARALAERLAEGAAARDRDPLSARADLDELARSGLLGITVPPELGGAGCPRDPGRDLPAAGRGRPSIAQVLLPHFVLLGAVLGLGTRNCARR
ncbi:acyl-CoA dehydrogenase family protein [Streptomyces sp. M19]